MAFIKSFAALCALILLGATQPGFSPEGRWLTEKKNGIRYCGQVTRLDHGGIERWPLMGGGGKEPSLDPDPAL